MVQCLKRIIKGVLGIDRRRIRNWFLSDADFFLQSRRAEMEADKVHAEAWIVIQYHVVEKGLTMPNRRLSFGKSVIVDLIKSVNCFVERWRARTASVNHAIGVVKTYYALHKDQGQNFSDDVCFWNTVEDFVLKFPDVPDAVQIHQTNTGFYEAIGKEFPLFARSRHTVRNYTGEAISKETIVRVVELAMTAPSACNRQHVRVHCIANKDLAHRILDVQGGNRGFGHLADKVLVVTADLAAEMGARERHDPYVNGGIFIMNLCYALHYHRIAHCILSCSLELPRIAQIRSMASIPDQEVVVGMLSCGIAPKEFDVASSPRKSVWDVMVYKD